MSTASKHFQPFMMAEERAARSVFVGNIPYEATEEQLKEIFAQAGPVVSFRLVYDRETGKPKGYGFCEYQDVETAQSAMRNLNNHDFNGRPLRVGVAAGEQTKDENRAMQQALGGAVSESPYGEPVDPEKAPEAISRAVASLPPEQMFELMKQMKLCIQNNPNEARNMLLQNPQLAYALLQAQIVMKIVDPQVALAMLHRQTEQIPPVMPSGNSQAFQHQNSNSMMDNKASVLASSRPGFPANVSGGFSVASGVLGSGNRSYRSESSPIDAHEVMIDQQNLVSCDRRETLAMERHSMPVKDWQDFQTAPRRDLPFSVGHGLSDTAGAVSGLRNSESKVEMVSKLGLGSRPGYDSGSNQRLDISTSRMLSGAAGIKQDNLQTSRQEQQLPSCKAAVRENEPAVNSRVEVAPEIRDPRQAAEIRRSIVSQGPTSRLTMPILGPSVSSANSVSAHDQEKAALIMQVLQLSDEQIAMLPEDQRQSIMILKEQIARSAS